MEKEFAPYEPSLALKELGFDEPCFAWYAETKNLQISPDVYKKWTSKPCNNSNIIIVFNSDCVTAPTFSQAFRWFREKYNIRQNIMDFIDDEIGIEWDYEIAIIGTDLDERGNYKPLVDYSTDDETRKFKTYEEAELACLKELIEIVKQKQ